MSQIENTQYGGLSKRVYAFADLVLLKRLGQALEEGAARYPIYRELRFAARVELEVLLDAIALEPAWRAQRLGAESLVLDGDGLFVAAYGARKADYCSIAFYVWGADLARAEAAKRCILDKAGSTRITEPMFSIDWHFLTSGGQLESASIEEMADDLLRDRAYPEIEGGVRAFIARYLEAPETVLVLQGPPGTGKTRLIRAILGEMSRRKGKDADHLLKPRADGNEHLHRFLAIADGVVRAQGRKIVFSTNLPNVGDLDDALIRPGRCFARVHVRNLTAAEAQALAAEIDPRKILASGEARKRSLAEIYRELR